MRCLGHRADYSTRYDCSLLPGALALTGLAGAVVQKSVCVVWVIVLITILVVIVHCYLERWPRQD